MPNIVAPVLKQVQIDRLYEVGDTFRQPANYADSCVVDQWLQGTLGDFDLTLLEDWLQESLTYPEWVAARKSMLACGDCH